MTVDVKEQNPAACRFCEPCGFVDTGRSALDSTDHPFPLVHMRLAARLNCMPPNLAQRPDEGSPLRATRTCE